VQVNSKKRLAKSDETGNVENQIWHELVKLHTINKEKPTKKLVGRKRKVVRRKARNITQYPPRGLGIRSVPGNIIGTDSRRRPSFLAFFRSDSSNDEGTHLVATLLLPFFVIFSLCATFLMGIHKRCAQGLRGECKSKEEEEMEAAEEQRAGKQ
jgi:hypothetical protein